MTSKEFICFIIGILTSIMLTFSVGKIYIDNLKHVTCKMYNTVDDKYRFDYVNKQFKCEKL